MFLKKSNMRVNLESFANTCVENTLGAVGNPTLLAEQGRLLTERARGALDTEVTAIAKLEGFLGAVSFPCDRNANHAFVDWGELFNDFPWVDRVGVAGIVPIYTNPLFPIPYLSLCHPTTSLAFLRKADSAVVRSVCLACDKGPMESWESLVEIMRDWTSLKNVTFTSSFFEGNNTAIVRLFVLNLDIDGFTFYGPVVNVLGPDFFQGVGPCKFSFPSTAAYGSQTVTWPLFECCELGDITAFFAGLPATGVSFGAEDIGWDKPDPEHLEPLVAALDALSCTEVSLIGFRCVDSSPGLLSALFGGKFEKVALDSASPELSVGTGLAEIVASNTALRSLEVRYFGDFESIILEFSTSIRDFRFGRFADFADFNCRKGCVLDSELGSLSCSGLDLEAEYLCGVFRDARKKAKRRARCLLHCCLQLAPTAHEHIVPSIGAVPLDVLRGAVEDAGERTAETVSRETVPREKRETSWPDEQREAKRR